MNYEEEWEQDFKNWTFKDIPDNIQCCRHCATQENCFQECIAPDRGCFLLRPTNPHPNCDYCIAQDCGGFDYTTPRPNLLATNNPKVLATIRRKAEELTCWGCLKDFPEAKSFKLVYWCSRECLEAWLERKNVKSHI